MFQPEAGHSGVLVARREPEGGTQLVDDLGTIESVQGDLTETHVTHVETMGRSELSTSFRLLPDSFEARRSTLDERRNALGEVRVLQALGAVGNPGSELMAFRCRPPDSHDRLAGERWVKRREYDLLAMEQLEGRIAVVTGAANGIGLAIVEAFVDEDMRVIAADVDEEKLEVQAARLRNQGADIHAVAVDVRDSDAVDRVGRAAIERFGALHVAVNNAGVVMTGNSWEIALEEWHRVIDIDLWGVIHGIRTFVPLILTSGQEGHVVNVASMAAVLPLGEVGPYTVAKHGVLGLSDVLSAELEALGAPVGVSVVMPGLIRTAMNPIGTVEPSAVARNVVDAIRSRRSYVFTDDHFLNEVEDRLRAILSARSDVCD
jgi:NAD(P)-dependent dehydrogenase (short-subunit alcohol dehydrogenase family)